MISADKAFKGTAVNLALPSLHGGSLEIARTVPLTKKFQGFLTDSGMVNPERVQLIMQVQD